MLGAASTTGPVAAVTYVYRFYDRGGRLLYVGVTSNTKTRFKAHEAKPWWPEVHRRTIREHPNRELALAAEAMAIMEERPRYNVARPGAAAHERLYAAGTERSMSGASPHDPVTVINRAYDRIEALEAELRAVRAALAAEVSRREADTRNQDGPSQYQRALIEQLRDQLSVAVAEERAATKRAEKAERDLELAKLRRIVAAGRRA